MTVLQEQAIRLIEKMRDEQLSRVIVLLQSMEDDVQPAKDGEALARSRAAFRLMDELEKGMRSGIEQGWLNEEQVRVHVRSRMDAM